MFNKVVYYKNGKVQYKRTIDENDLQQGKEVWYWDKGNIWYEAMYKDNMLHGVRKRFNQKGKYVSSDFWYNDEIVTEEFYIKQNRLDKLNKILNKL